MRKSRFVSAIFFATSISFAATSFAQSASRDAAAQKFFDEGRALMAAQRFAEACQKFDTSDKLSPAGGTLLNLADCYEKAGKTASAWAKYNEAADRANAAKRADAEQFARGHAKALQNKLSYVKLVIAPETRSVAGLTITIDGASLAPAVWDTQIPIDPGDHVVVTSAPGKKSATAHSTVAAGSATNEIAIAQLDDLPAPPPAGSIDERPPENGDSSKGSTQRILGIGMGAVGLVGIGIGAFFGVSAISEHNSINCPNDTCNSQADADTNKKSQTAALVSTIGFIGGGVLATAGVVLFLTAPKSERPSEHTNGLRIVPSFASSSGRVLLEGAF